MAKRKEPTDGSNTNRNNGGYDELICTECGSSNIISSAGDQYCGDCGAVLESIILTTHHSYEAEHAASGTKYQRISQHVDTSDPGSVRLHNRWNQEMIRQSKSAIVGLCRQLGIQNIAERAERMFVDSSRGFMSAGEEWVFGRRTSVRIAACVYISALQDGKALTLVDIARTAQVSVYVIGHEAKRTLAILHIKLPLLDPLLRVEQAVNRIFGCALKTRDDTEERRLVVEQISGKTKKAQGFPVQLVDFIEANEELRPRLIELSGQIMTFDRICSLSTGVNPNTLVCSAVSMGLEHFYVSAPETEEGVLKRSHREVLFRLVTLFNGAGQHTVLRHVSALQKALVEAGKTAPWLAGTKLTTDNVAVHLSDVMFCYEQARAWLFSIQESQHLQQQQQQQQRMNTPPNAEELESLVSSVVTRLSKAPSFARAEKRREQRRAILSKFIGESKASKRQNEQQEQKPWYPPPFSDGACKTKEEGEEATKEIETIGRLYKLGVDQNALINLPLYTLEQIGAVASREITLKECQQRLDSAIVGSEDMSEDELLTYVDYQCQNIQQALQPSLSARRTKQRDESPE